MLSELFPDADYRLQMRFRRGPVAEYFRPTESHADVLAQRRHWLETAPRTYAALLPAGVPLLEEAIGLAEETQTLDSPASVRKHDSPWDRCLALGESWEPDYLLLKADGNGQFVLLGGSVCFPSSWSLAEKIGRPLEVIHGVVPDLNANLGDQIQTFLARLRPGLAWQRTNWGLTRSPELNQHPERGLPRLDATVGLDDVWLRVEYQALVALPKTEGILFGIRIAVHPLAEVKKDAAAARGLVRALATMSEAMARYKGFAASREKIMALLES